MNPHEPRERAAQASSAWGPSLTALALVFATTATAACGRVPGQFEIVQNQVPQPGCLIDTSESSYRGDGTLDLTLVQPGARAAYLVFPLLKNNLPGATGQGPDGNQIDMHSFAIDIGESKYGSLPPNVRTLFNTLNGAAHDLDRLRPPSLQRAVVGHPRLGRRHGGDPGGRLSDRSQRAHRRHR